MDKKEMFSSPFSGTFFQYRHVVLCCHADIQSFRPLSRGPFFNAICLATVQSSMAGSFRPLSRGPFFNRMEG